MHGRHAPTPVGNGFDRIHAHDILVLLGTAAGYVPFVVGYSNRLGAPYTILLYGALVVLFSFGYLAMVRRVPRTGAFSAYISTGLGKRPGLAAGSMSWFFTFSRRVV